MEPYFSYNSIKSYITIAILILCEKIKILKLFRLLTTNNLEALLLLLPVNHFENSSQTQF